MPNATCPAHTPLTTPAIWRWTRRVSQGWIKSPLSLRIERASIAVLGAQPGRESQQELSALEFGEPFGDDLSGGIGGGGHQAGGAGGAELLGGQAAVDGEGARDKTIWRIGRAS
jgi:hypothetical protein